MIFISPIGIATPLEEKKELETLGSSTYVVVPISINVVEGTSISKETIEANIKKMNEIYNCEVVIFVWDGTINTIPDPSKPGGTADGAVTNLDDRTTVRNKASENAGGKGVSITVATDLGDNTNGITIVGGAHSAMVTNSTDGTTWAHEVQHSLGQSHGDAKPADEDLDGDGDKSDDTGWDVNGDGQVTNADRGYNLWGRRSDRTGNDMTSAQHSAILGNASALPGARVKKRPQVVQDNPKVPAKTGVVTDNRSDTVNQTGSPKVAPFIDNIIGGIIKNYTAKILKLWLRIAGMVLDNCTYDFYFDYIESMGAPNPWDLGADALVRFIADPVGGWEAWAYMWNNLTLNWVSTGPLGPFWTKPLNETINYDNYTGSGWVESFFDVMIGIEIPETDPFGGWLYGDLEGNFNMWIYSEYWNGISLDILSDQTSKFGVTLLSLPAETISIKSENVNAGSTMQINGTAFSPNGKVTIYIDGTNISTVTADPTGNFSTTITIPNTPKNNAILMLRDDTGKVDAVYINIKAVVPETPAPIPFMYLPVVLIAFGLAIFLNFKRKPRVI
ncbi:MAG: hypothetical protein ACTSRS_02505 [Candidatus Helarchaeota archaeon]